MYYFLTLFIIGMAFPVAAQDVAETAEIDSLQKEMLHLNHLVQKAKAQYHFERVTFDSTLAALGYGVIADTTDGDYIQLVMPDSLRRETKLILREVDIRGIRFIKTDDANVIRVHKNRLPRIVKALSDDREAFPAPTR